MAAQTLTFNKDVKMKYITKLLFLLYASSTLATGWDIESRAHTKYPLKLISKGLNACATIQFFVDKDGNTKYIEPLTYTEDIAFAEAAVESIKLWQFTSTGSAQAQRKKVTIDFAVDMEWENQGQCYAELSNESHDIEQFRLQRMSMNIDFNDADKLLEGLRRAAVVMSEEEISLFSHALGESFPFYHQDQLATLKRYDGYSIQGLLDRFSRIDTSLFETAKNELDSNLIDPTLLPSKDLMYAWKNWQVNDMKVAMKSELYQKISYEKLLVEIAIDDKGNGHLISTCRQLPSDVEFALRESVNNWTVTKIANDAKGFRMLWQVPSPDENGAFIHCDDHWHPEFRPQVL